MASNLSMQLLASVGAAILAILQVANFNDVLKNQVPWGIILTVCGMMFLMKQADAMNVVTSFATPLANANLPIWLLPAALLAVNGILTYFCDGRAVSPMLQPPRGIPDAATALSGIRSAWLPGGGCILKPDVRRHRPFLQSILYRRCDGSERLPG